MRNLIKALLLAAVLVVSACGTDAAQFAREKLVDGMGVYCTQSQAVRLEIREWVNETSPHEARVDCAGDQP